VVAAVLVPLGYLAALGVGGLAGAHADARIQSRMPDALIRRLVGILVIAIDAYYRSSGPS
jgi:uncharacterized membrane protein YfcA